MKPLRRWQHVARGVSEAMFDFETSRDPERMAWFLADLDEFLIAAGIKTRTAILFGLFTIQYSPLFLSGRPRRFTSLPLQTRIELLERYELSPLSILMAAVKLVSALVFFEHPRSLMECGLEPRVVWPGVEQAMPHAVQPRSSGAAQPRATVPAQPAAAFAVQPTAARATEAPFTLDETGPLEARAGETRHEDLAAMPLPRRAGGL